MKILLEERGVCTDEDRHEFLNPRLQNLSDPLRLPDMLKAVERVERAIEHDESILIYSDYDVDGMTSGALLYRFLKTLGAEAGVFLPDRMMEGYGLTMEGLRRALLQRQPRLLLALDCGTTSAKEIEFLAEQGIEVIIIDHHELPAQLPEAYAFVNPHRSTEAEDQFLATVGLVFKFCHALLKIRDDSDLFDLKKHLDLVALGTVADLVPLQKDNRILVQQGLKGMGSTHHVGLKELMRRAGIKGLPTPSTCGYILGPRLNASGRLAQGRSGWELLTTDDHELARQIADELEILNRRRQQIELQAVNEAEAWLEENYHPQRDRCIVVASKSWHQGVVGIVASRLMRKYYRPTVVISVDESGLGKGSCRGIEGCSLMDALRDCENFLQTFGGHAMAAGLEIDGERIDAFRAELNRWHAEHVKEIYFEPRLNIDFELGGKELSAKLAATLAQMEPFGRGNPSPVFVVKDVEVITPRIFAQKHLRFRGRADGKTFDVVAFGMGSQKPPSARPNLAGYWEVDDYTGNPCFRMIHWSA